MGVTKQSRWWRVKERRRAVILAVVFFLVFFSASLLFESSDQLEFSDSACEIVQSDATPPKYEKIYPWLTTHLLGRASSGHVAIVYIPLDLDEVQQNLCTGRSYMADLVRTLTGIKGSPPAAIVIDKYFGASPCKSYQNLTDELTGAVQAAGIPVIVGESTTSAPEETQGSCLVQNPQQLDFKAPQIVHRGLTKLNANREQIPVSWPVLNHLPPLASSSRKESISLVAAEAVPSLIDNPNKLQSISTAPRHPYARLNLKLPAESSTALLCSSGSPEVRTRWHCNEPTPVDASMASPLQNSITFDPAGKVVVIGSQSESDHRAVLGRRTWGYELQAEYVDALLSGKYLRALPGQLLFWTWIAFLVLLESVPVIAAFLKYEQGKVVPRVFLPADNWILLFGFGSILSVLLGSLVFGYLPPLLLLFGFALAVAVRYIISKREHYKHLFIPHEKDMP